MAHLPESWSVSTDLGCDLGKNRVSPWDLGWGYGEVTLRDGGWR